MKVYYSDELNKLDGEIRDLMEAAACCALENEFKDSLNEGISISDIPVELSVSVVQADDIKAINRDFRGIDKVTDVLSFPQFADNAALAEELASYEYEECDEEEPALADVSDGEIEAGSDGSEFELSSDDSEFEADCGLLLGDVVICYDRALEQAEEYGTGIRRELVYLFVHSIFHLLGYDHMEEREKAEMRRREEEVLSAIGVGR